MGKKIRLGKPFPPFDPFDLTSAREHAFGAFFGTAKHRVKVRFDHVAAPFVREKRWNKTQKITECEDGGVDFEITVCDLVEIKAWILSWGMHARATGPKRLLDDIKADLKEMKKQYA